ncbi:MAG TPA: hypothetical protein VKK79_17050 [Candidatus Lokiarchaeia archaeon]|nr:hypothetical protein [Candidatus Lokiarchaeia archaeon]
MPRHPSSRRSYNPHLKHTLMKTAENQIRDGTLPEAKQTLDRLLSLGYSRQEAVEKIAGVIAEETYYILRDQRKFDEEQYVSRLQELA